MQTSTASSNGAKIVLWLLILGMLVFTAIRTVHFLQLTFPPDQAYVAYLGLVAFDVGVLGWFYYATTSAHGAMQRAVAYGMIFVCAFGVVATTIADILIVTSGKGLSKLSPDQTTTAVWVVIVVICLNFIGGLVVHLVDPRHLQKMKEESLRDSIIDATHTAMEREKAAIAPQIAQTLAQHWARQITEQMVGRLAIGAPQHIVDSTLATLPQQASIAAPATAQEEAPQQIPEPSESGLKALFHALTNVLSGKPSDQALPTFLPTPGIAPDGPAAVRKEIQRRKDVAAQQSTHNTVAEQRRAHRAQRHARPAAQPAASAAPPPTPEPVTAPLASGGATPAKKKRMPKLKNA